MKNIEIISIEKARDNGHCYTEIRISDDCGAEFRARYSFKVASCKPCYGNVMIDTLTSRPVPAEHFDEFCWDFEGLDLRSESMKSQMISEFRRQACG